MKAGFHIIFLSLSLAVAAEAEPGDPVAESNGPSSGSGVRGRIMELLKQDVQKAPVKSKAAIAPKLDPPANDQPIADDLLELEPIQVTQKRPIELPPRPTKPTLDNFFYGDGAIWKSADGRRTLSIGPYGERGLAAIQFSLKF